MNVKTYTDIYNIVEVEDVLQHENYVFTPRSSVQNKKINNTTPENYYINNVIKTKIYTDGQLVKIDEEKPQPISEYYINEKKYQYSVDTLIKKHLHIKNASYIVKVTIAHEWTSIGKFSGWFDIIENTEIFLNNKKDKKALKKAKETIEMISKPANFNSIFDITIPKNNINTLQYKKVDNTAYQLTKSKY